MTPEELAAKHLPMNTTCPMKRKKITYQREQLANDIRAYYLSTAERVQGNLIEKK